MGCLLPKPLEWAATGMSFPESRRILKRSLVVLGVGAASDGGWDRDFRLERLTLPRMTGRRPFAQTRPSRGAG